MKHDPTDADRRVYAQTLRGFLPERIFDAHVHLFDAGCLNPGARFPPKNCYWKFGGVSTVENYRQVMAALLPEQTLYWNSFGQPSAVSDRDAAAAYTGRISDNRQSFGMALVSPHDSVETIMRRVESNRLIGYKPYLNFVDWKPAADITIHDMLPAAQMAAAQARGLAVMLHIPRPGRLADPVNQAQMVELCRAYPDAQIVFAHIGRAYYLQNVIGFLDGIAACPNAWIDTSMVNHEGVLEHAFRVFPRERILFGTDAPIAFLHGKSVEINHQYAYLMAEDYAIGTTIHATGSGVAFTTFLYEQLGAIRLAAERAGLTGTEVEDILFNNAHRLFTSLAQADGSGIPASQPPDARSNSQSEGTP